MADIEDPVYLYVENQDDPRYGQTIVAPGAEWRKDIKGFKAMGYRPATGKELEPVQQSERMKMAAESPGTAAALGGLRGATFGLSDVALRELGGDEGELEELRRANPKISAASEIGGALATGGVLARGGAALASQLPSSLARGMAGGALTGGTFGAGSKLGEQARAGEGYDIEEASLSGLKGAAIGAAVPAGIKAVGAGASLAGRGALVGGTKAAELGAKTAGLGAKASEMAVTQFDKIGSVGRSAAALATGGKSEGARLGVKAAAPVLRTVEKQLERLAKHIRSRNPEIGVSKSKELAKAITEGRSTSGGLSTAQMVEKARGLQQSRVSGADAIDEEIRLLLSQMRGPS